MTMKMDHKDIYMGSQGKKQQQKQMDASKMPLNATFLHTIGIAIIMPGSSGLVGHLCAEKDTENQVPHSLCINPSVCTIQWAMLCQLQLLVLTGIARPNTYFGHFIF